MIMISSALALVMCITLRVPTFAVRINKISAFESQSITEER
jgi:hypothetical protein